MGSANILEPPISGLLVLCFPPGCEDGAAGHKAAKTRQHENKNKRE